MSTFVAKGQRSAPLCEDHISAYLMTSIESVHTNRWIIKFYPVSCFRVLLSVSFVDKLCEGMVRMIWCCRRKHLRWGNKVWGLGACSDALSSGCDGNTSCDLGFSLALFLHVFTFFYLRQFHPMFPSIGFQVRFGAIDPAVRTRAVFFFWTFHCKLVGSQVGHAWSESPIWRGEPGLNLKLGAWWECRERDISFKIFLFVATNRVQFMNLHSSSWETSKKWQNQQSAQHEI